MPRTLYIPPEVRESIREHLKAAVAEAAAEYLSGGEDEDTVTGDLGANLRVKNRQVDAPSNVELSGPWRWSITY